MTEDIEKIVEWECHTSGKITKWDYAGTVLFPDGKHPMYECRCCGVARYGAKIQNEK